jgi:hypothetical protein
MKRSIIALALAAFAVASFADEQYRNNVGESEDNVVKQQLADAEEWLRSRPGGQPANADESEDNVVKQQLADAEEWLRSRPGGAPARDASDRRA